MAGSDSQGTADRSAIRSGHAWMEISRKLLINQRCREESMGWMTGFEFHQTPRKHRTIKRLSRQRSENRGKISATLQPPCNHPRGVFAAGRGTAMRTPPPSHASVRSRFRLPPSCVPESPHECLSCEHNGLERPLFHQLPLGITGEILSSHAA